MKYLLAFALIAVAMALPEPARLLQPVQLADLVAPLVVPQKVMDEVALKVNFVDTPAALETLDAVKIVEAPIEADSEIAVLPENNAADFAVNFVEEAVNVDAPEAPVDAVQFVDAPVENDASDYAVHFVEEAVNVDAPETAEAPVDAVQFVDAPVGNDASDHAVHFVEEAVNVDAPQTPVDAVQFVDAPVGNDASDYAVKFVDEAINVAPEASNVVDAADIPMQIKIVDIPLPDSVVMHLTIPISGNVKIVDTPIESNADFAVKFVDVADVDEESPSYMPTKVYPNPMWR